MKWLRATIPSCAAGRESLRTLNIKVEERRDRTSPDVAVFFLLFVVFFSLSTLFLWLYEAAGEGEWVHFVHVFELTVRPIGAWNVLVVYSCSPSATVATSSNMDSISLLLFVYVLYFLPFSRFLFLYWMVIGWRSRQRLATAAILLTDFRTFPRTIGDAGSQDVMFWKEKELNQNGSLWAQVCLFRLVVKDFKPSNFQMSRF